MNRGTGACHFFARLIGIVLLFTALGPPVGGALFVPLAIALKPPAAADALVLSALIAALLGHTVMLVAAYVVGVGPATATGFFFALWDAAALERWPRSIVAALIGGATAFAALLRLAAIGASVEFTIRGNLDASTAAWIDAASSGGIGSALAHAFVAGGVIAGVVLAMAASLVGPTMRPPRARDLGAI